MVLGVPILKHFRVSQFAALSFLDSKQEPVYCRVDKESSLVHYILTQGNIGTQEMPRPLVLPGLFEIMYRHLL